MAVSSFAGGSVGTMKMLSRMGQSCGIKVPEMLTSSAWQFTFYEVYSAIYANEPAQFVFQNPTVRIPWWDFPHPALLPEIAGKRLKELYDLAIDKVESLNPTISTPSIVI